jgi:ParB family chromosome partitioning protein
LPQPIKDSLRNGELGLGHAKAIMSVPDADRQVEIWQRAVEERYSVRKLEELARNAAREITGLPPEGTKSASKAKKPAASEPEVEQSSELISIENSFKHLLGTQVKVRLKSDASGEIAIQFYTYEDLDRIRELLETIQPA